MTKLIYLALIFATIDLVSSIYLSKNFSNLFLKIFQTFQVPGIRAAHPVDVQKTINELKSAATKYIQQIDTATTGLDGCKTALNALPTILVKKISKTEKLKEIDALKQLLSANKTAATKMQTTATNAKNLKNHIDFAIETDVVTAKSNSNCDIQISFDHIIPQNIESLRSMIELFVDCVYEDNTFYEKGLTKNEKQITFYLNDLTTMLTENQNSFQNLQNDLDKLIEAAKP